MHTIHKLLYLCIFAALADNSAAAEVSDKPPGIVIAHRPAAAGVYVGSPSMVILPNGDIIASYDGFGPSHEFGRSYLFRSTDSGANWQPLPDVEDQNTSTLFVHHGKLYLMGLGSQLAGGPKHIEGDTAVRDGVVIRRSEDGGNTWTTPRDEQSGVLLTDGPYSTAPVPVVNYGGRVWRAVEDSKGPGEWAGCFRAFMMSAPENADLLHAKNWTSSNVVGRDTAWLSGEFEGWLEGNAVVTPAGQIVNILRVHYFSYNGDKAAMIRVSPDGKTATFDPETGFVQLPDAAKKFTIRYDPKSKHYWSLTNSVPRRHRKGGAEYQGGNPESTRNTLTLVSSPDLASWKIEEIVLYHPDTTKHGFQYADWQFDGDDIVAVVRTSHDDGVGGAHDMHDANFLTFHRIQEFRRLLKQQLRDPLKLFVESP
jgi:hypothetical protein